MSDAGGRPPIPPEKRKTEHINFRVTQPEFDALCKAAAKRGYALGDYLMRRAGFRVDETSNPFTVPVDGSNLRTNR